MPKNKQKKERVLMPIWADVVFTAASKIFLFFKYHVKYDRRPLKDYRGKSCMLIYTHYSNKDHYFIKASTNYRRVNFVLASYFFFNKTLNRVLNWAKAISKDQFKPDVTAIRRIKKVLDAKGMIAIAPAGQTSMDGNSPYISEAIVKLIRMCKTDVLALQLHGVYQTFPKWRKSKRRTKMFTKFVPVLKREELEHLTDEEIYQRVCASLDLRAFDELKESGNVLVGKDLALGLEDAIIKCPKCGALCSYEASGNQIKCTNCGNTAVLENNGEFIKNSDTDQIFSNLPLWYDWQRSELGKAFTNGELTLDEEVVLISNLANPKALEECGSGHLVLTPTMFYYEGTFKGQPYKKEFKLAQIQQLPFESNVRFEVPDEEAMFRFRPTRDIRLITVFVLIIDYLNKERVKN